MVAEFATLPAFRNAAGISAGVWRGSEAAQIPRPIR